MKSVKILAVLLALSVAGVASAAKPTPELTVKVTNGQTNTISTPLSLTVGSTTVPASAIFQCTARGTTFVKAPAAVTASYNTGDITCAVGTLGGQIQEQQTAAGGEGQTAYSAVGVLSCMGKGTVTISNVDCSSNASASKSTTLKNTSNNLTF